MEEKKENKQRRTFTLKPINIAWLEQQSWEESTPGDSVSSSELVDRLIDEARLRAETPTPSKKNDAPQAREIAAHAVN